MVQLPSSSPCVQLHSFNFPTRSKGSAEDLEQRGANPHLLQELSTDKVCPCSGVRHPGEEQPTQAAILLASDMLPWVYSHGFQLWPTRGKTQLEKMVRGPLTLSSPTQARVWSAHQNHLCTYNSTHPCNAQRTLCNLTLTKPT